MLLNSVAGLRLFPLRGHRIVNREARAVITAKPGPRESHEASDRSPAETP